MTNNFDDPLIGQAAKQNDRFMAAKISRSQFYSSIAAMLASTKDLIILLIWLKFNGANLRRLKVSIEESSNFETF